MTKDRRLGRGLAALLGTPVEGEENGNVRMAPETLDDSAPAKSSSSQRGERGKTLNASQASERLRGVMSCELDVTQIDANPFQPRREFNDDEIASLAESLKTHQQLQPISVRRVGNRYQLISGERRLRATIHAGLTTIRAEVREADDRLVAELAIIENLQRKDLNAIEKAMSFKRYIQEHACTQEELASRLKIDRSTVANFMRLLELPASILDSVQKDELSASHAKAILSLGTEEQQLEYARLIRLEGWSVRETERRVADQVAREEAEDEGRVGIATRAKARAKSDQIAALEQSLKRQLGTKIEINQTSRGRGRIVIHFANVQEFERLRGMMESGSGTHVQISMTDLDLPWGWILWSIAVLIATSSLVKLALHRRDELQGKLDAYLDSHLKAIQHKKKILAEHRRRVALAKKLAEENAENAES